MRTDYSLNRNRTLFVLNFQMVLLAMGVCAVNPVLPQYTKSMGVNITMVGLIITAFGLTRLFSNMPASRLTLRFGRRPVLIIGALLQTVSALGAALVNSYWGLLAAWAIQGIGAGLSVVSAMIILADISTPNNRARVMATFQGCQLVGAGIGPIVGGFVAQAWGYQWVFMAYAIIAFLCLLINYFGISETREAGPTPSETRGHQQTEVHATAMRSSILTILRDLSFTLISLITMGIFIMRIAAQNQILPLLGQDRIGLSSGQIGSSMTVIIISQFIATFIGARLSDRFGRKIIITIGVIFSALSLIILALSYNFEMLIFSCVGMGIGMGIAGTISLTYVLDISTRNNFDTSMGLYRTITDLSFVIGPVLLGWLADTGGFGMALFFNSGFLLIIAIMFQIFARGMVNPKTILATGA